MLRRAASLSDDGLIRLEHLPRALGSVPPSAPAPASPESEPPPENGLRDELCDLGVGEGYERWRQGRRRGRLHLRSVTRSENDREREGQTCPKEMLVGPEHGSFEVTGE